MRSFLKIFFATLLALIVFVLLIVFVVGGWVVSTVSTSEKETIEPNAILVIDLGQPLLEQRLATPFSALLDRGPTEISGVFETISLIKYAATDPNIKGILVKAGNNPNGFATNEEIRNALLAFKQSHKFVYAYSNVMSQKSYYVASVADKIYLNPKGGVDFAGFSVEIMFLKGMLEKLEIQPQIFYDGKFKSATEPLREEKMTEANRIQTQAFLGDLYRHFLQKIAQQRKIDTANLYRYANEGLIQTAYDAVKYKLVDALKYDDEVMDEMKSKLALKSSKDIPFVSLRKYAKAVDYRNLTGDGRIALIYAQGDIVDKGSGDHVRISAENYVKLIRKVRQDKSIKAIVFRVNSPGGSSLASDEIWRELSLAKNSKPVVVSMGDYAASGGYYISCMADSIYAQPNTLTGSIGVFGVIPNLQSFFKNKLGITFDGVKTAQYADLGTASRPLNEAEKRFVQNSVDSIYADFKSRVMLGRKLSKEVVDSVAQGRVWSGIQAQQLGLVDRLGGINDAIACAARMAKLPTYKLKEYPEVEDPFEKLFKSFSGEIKTEALRSELGKQYDLYQQMKKIMEWQGTIQARLPYVLEIR